MKLFPARRKPYPEEVDWKSVIETALFNWKPFRADWPASFADELLAEVSAMPHCAYPRLAKGALIEQRMAQKQSEIEWGNYSRSFRALELS